MKSALKFFKGGKEYSLFNEEDIIKKYLSQLTGDKKFCVDIGASDGVSMSNTYRLFKNGWQGIAVEFDASKFVKLASAYSAFKNVFLVKTKVSPENILSILDSCFCPVDFDFLSLDIDSYDFFVIDALLSKYRPKLMCIEINEKIPPPISFTVKYDPDCWWSVDHFYGHSISKAYELCKKYQYDIVELEYNNLFLIPTEMNTSKALSPEEAYDIGYRNRQDRKIKMPWNSDMEALLTMSKEEGITFLNRHYEKYHGKYIIE